MRKDTYRVNTETVQGEGSWVELKQLMHGEWTAFAQAGREEVNRTIEASVSAWNWTDRDGNSLSLPTKAANDLTELERAFLINALLWPLSHLAKN